MKVLSYSNRDFFGLDELREVELRRQKELSRRSSPLPKWKRCLDVACILICLPALFPIMVCIAVLIKLVSSGPVLFRQKRVGYLGKPFTLFKFRTMAAGVAADVHQGHFVGLMKSNAPMQKIDLKDKRLIPFGLALRASGLDELPQLINVLRGNMSLVGPRPCLPYEYDNYLPWQKERFYAIPGLTGLWQISGKNRTTFDEMMRLDIDYVHTKSLRKDLFILLMTVPALIAQIRDVRHQKKNQRRSSPATAIEERRSPSMDSAADPGGVSFEQPIQLLIRQHYE
jgi:lipopolysaccharide/colanic/teichoic acid biosynthesis glycosyltransferase